MRYWKSICLVTLAIVLMLSGCKTKTMELSYLALGDSYTIGESVDISSRWPVQLARLLSEDGTIVTDPLIIAKTGWTTDELIEGIDTSNLSGSYDLVSLLIGVNNQYRGRSIENFRMEFKELVDIAIKYAGDNPSRLIVLSIPDWGVMPFAEGRDRDQIASEIDAYNDVCKEECSSYGIKYFDITGISRNAAMSPDLVADDGLHPSGLMYSEWVRLIAEEVAEMLN
jgi:lysophospholipase L1-like esterase